MKKIFTFYLVCTFFIFLSASLKAQTYCTPSYKGSGYGGSGKTTAFYTYIAEVHLGSINNILPTPTFITPTYTDSTTDSTVMVPGATYPMTVMLGNGANPQYMAVWIDWDQDQIFEKSERIVTRFDPADVGDHQVHFNITVPLNAAIGTTRMRIGTRIGIDSSIFIPDPCINNSYLNDWSQDFIDYSIRVIKQDVQVYKSCTSHQPVHFEITPGSTNNMVMQVVVSTNDAGILSPQTAGNFKFNLRGTTNQIDISAARLMYSGKDSRFEVATQVGSDISYPSEYFSIAAGQKLQPGDNYFWLVYDISSTALRGNHIDAQVYSVDVSGPRVPDTISPQGFRTIGYCPAHGTQNNFVFLYYVNFNTIGNFSGPNPGGYGDNTKIHTTVLRGNKYKLNLYCGNGANPVYTRAWIDFNADGDFNDPGEEVLFDSLAAKPGFFLGPDSISVNIPKTAAIGPTRMRVEAFFLPIPYIKPSSDPCRNPVVIGEVEDYTVIIGETGQPVPTFKADTVCQGTATKFTDSSYSFGAYKINSWSWDFGDGDTSNLKNPTHTYLKAGVYNVTLTVNSNKPGTPNSLKKAVIVNSPKANFTNLGSVFKTPVLLADSSSGGIATSWQWDFGDPASGVNDTSSVENPFHTFDTVGTYSVKLVLTMAGGCKDSIIKNIKIVPAVPPVADFSASSFNPHVTEQINLKDLSLYAPTSWQWTFSPVKISYYGGTGSSSQNPVVSFDSLTTYKVTLKVTNSAGSDTISRFFTTRKFIKPVCDFTANNTYVKSGQAVSFLDLSKNDPITWLWKLGNGDSSLVQNPIVKYKNTGTYTISLAISNPAGSDSKTKTNFITVASNYVMCQSDAAYSPLFAGDIADSGDSTGYYNFSNCGFLIKPDCAGPVTLVFDSFGMLTHDYIKVYDGVDNTGIPLFSGLGFTGFTNPGSVIANSGAMFIEEVTDDTGRGPGFRANWYAVPNAKPKANFVVDTIGYVNSPVSFTNTTLLGVNNTYYWDFNNDGIIDDYTDANGTYTFNKTGTYKAKLIAFNCKGRDSVYKTIKIINPSAAPSVDFTASADTILLGDSVTFYDRSSNGPTAWKWSFFPDSLNTNYGFTNGTSSVNVYFSSAGPYDVTLTASNSLGKNTRTKKALVYVKDVESMCGNTSSSAQFGKLYDDGGRDNNYSHSKNCHFLINTCGQQLYIHFNYVDIYAGDVIYVYDGFDNTGTLLAFYTANASSTLPTLYSKTGSLYVMEVTGSSGILGAGFDADWGTIPFPKPSAAFTGPDTAYTGGSPAHFDATNPIADTWAWDLDGDGKTDTAGQHVKYSYTKKGTYKVRLVVSHCNETDTAFHTVVVVDPTKAPVVDFSADMVNANVTDTIQFTDLSKNGPNAWKWRFNPSIVNYAGGTDSLSQDPKIQSGFPGRYTVELIASNSLGSDTLTKLRYLNIFRYCIPLVSNKGTDVGFTRVKLGTIDNFSPLSRKGYTDYTGSISTRLELQGTYSIHVERVRVSPPEKVKVWIDYNQNGSFNDAGEMIVADTNHTSATSWTDSFIVPKGAKQGSTRMRVGSGTFIDSVSSCGPSLFGEFEDYRIIIGTDLTPPVITIKGANPASVEIGYAYTDSGATAYDAIDGNVTSKIKVSSTVDTGKAGTYYVTYTVTDSAGNSASATRTVVVTGDKTPPVLTLLGPNPEKIEVFYRYIEYGAKAIDNRDGNVSKNVSIDTSGLDTFRLGTYYAYYTAVDNSGNFSSQVKRTVIVMDTMAPVITLVGPDTLDWPLHTAFVEPGANVVDNYWPALKLTITGKVDTSKTGTYKLSYNAKDGSGNIARTVRRVVRVQSTGIVRLLPDGWQVSVYPVPARDNFIVKLKTPDAHSVIIELINTFGQVIQRQDAGIIQEKQWTFNTGTMRSGIYFLRISSNQGTYIQKIQILK